MSAEVQNNITEQKPSDKELNFRKLEEKYERVLSEERAARVEMEKEIQRLAQAALHDKDKEDEDDSEPYVDHKKLKKTLSKFNEQSKKETQNDIQKAVHSALNEERKNTWQQNNPDFYEVLQHADKFAQNYPALAESILTMPEGFERQKLVYKNIKALGIDKPEVKQPSIQDKIDANRRSPYYQPSGISPAPYAGAGDFSPSGQKNAYDKMKELQNRLRI